MIEQFAREILHAVAASQFDPAPVVLTSEHDRGIAPVRRVLQREAGEVHQIRKALNRNEFLAGCFASTVEESIEHLIVGFGQRYRSTTRIDSVRHEIGERHRVAVPEDLRKQLNAHVLAGPAHEVLVFHNHPANPLHPLLDNEPLASTADRQLLARMRYLQPFIGLKTLFGRGNVRFYIGENGFVREFTAPAIKDLLALVQRRR